MKRRIYFILLMLISLLILKAFFSQEKYNPTWESLKKYQIPDWFRDAKFGIFIHWGVYSVPAFAVVYKIMFKK
ncbi:hypothetical protein BH20BAC1_BH20BAC1_10320 [soil metagenome]